MQRDLLLIGEMVEAAGQIQQLVAGVTLDELGILHPTATQQLPPLAAELRNVLATLKEDA